MSETTVVITGASNGIGNALAVHLSQKGVRVIAMDMVAPTQDSFEYIALDLSDPSSITQAVEALPEAIDGVCHSAGLPPRDGLQEAILGVNFFGTRALSLAMERRLARGASVVNLASRAGARWRDNLDQVKRLAAIEPGQIAQFVRDEQIDHVRAYDLSKEALIVWTMANSERMASKGFRINSISPGAVETRILEDFAAAFGERMSKNVARAGRAGTADEIAKLAAFLLSDDSSWIKGTDISIDGGMSAFFATDMLELGALTAAD